MAKAQLRKKTDDEIPSTDAEIIETLDHDLEEQLDVAPDSQEATQSLREEAKGAGTQLEIPGTEGTVGRPQVFEHPQPTIDNQTRIVHSED